MTLLTNPSDKDSHKFKLEVPYFEDGSPEELLELKQHLDTIFKGQNIKDATEKIEMLKRLLKGGSLTAYNNIIKEEEGKEKTSFKRTWNKLVAHVFPTRALRMQTRYMRRALIKPRDLTVKEYFDRVEELNRMLAEFPKEGKEGEAMLSSEELIDLLEGSIPIHWTKKLFEQGWDPQNHTLQQFREYCERLELLEQLPSKKKRTNVESFSPKNQEDSRPKKKQHFCKLHGPNITHDSSECRVINDQVQKMKEQWEAQVKKPHESKYKKAQKMTHFHNKEEIAQMQVSAAKTAVQLFAKQLGKKKQKKNKSESVQAIETLDEDLKDLEDLSLGSNSLSNESK